MLDHDELKFISGVTPQNKEDLFRWGCETLGQRLGRPLSAEASHMLMVRTNLYVNSGVPMDIIGPAIFQQDMAVRKDKDVLFVSDLSEYNPRNNKPFKLHKLFPSASYAKIFRNNLNMLFLGPNGVGKSFTAVDILMAGLNSGLSGFYTTSNQLYRVYNDNTYGDRSYPKLYQKLRDCHVLVIDELGKEPQTTAFVVWFEDFMRARNASNQVTVIASNLTPTGRTSLVRYGQSVMSVLDGHYHTLLFRGENLRREQKRSLLDYE